jgi:2-polyprenyl-3-methyl-5-hydroxy-6-metoxy-1,4-benzoquinol methylase
MTTLEQYFEANKSGWDIRTKTHVNSEFYGVEKWKKEGGNSLTPIELREIGDVRGKTILHLQCHFGQDTLSLARMGAQVTGCDLSPEAIKTAESLAQEIGINDAKFVCCNVYDLPQHLEGQFDMVFTSYGTIGWLPDLKPWAAVIKHFLKPGGTFYMADFHPVVWMMDDDLTHLKYAYHNTTVIETDQTGTYADRDAPFSYKEYGWNHSISEILNSLLELGLQLQFFNEYSYSPYNCFANTVQGADGFYRVKGLEDIIPMVYSLKMRVS